MIRWDEMRWDERRRDEVRWDERRRDDEMRQKFYSKKENLSKK